MSDIGFYHLTRTSADQALPRLLGRTLAAGQRAVVLCGSEARVTALDGALWASRDPDWLPHGTARTGEADLQPIWLTAKIEAPNAARYLFLTDGVAADATQLEWVFEGVFERVFDLFNGGDEASVQAARRRWSAAKAAGHQVTYWLQGERGWEKRA